MKKGLFRQIVCSFLFATTSLSAFGQIDIDRVMRIGKGAIYYRDYVVAIGYFNQVINARPWLADPYFYRSVAKISLDDYQGALQDANKCLEYNEFIPGAYLVKGISEQNTKQYDEAERSYRKGLKFEPNNEGLGLNLTNLLLYRKKYAAADTTAMNLLRYFPQSVPAKMMRIQAKLGLQDTVQSLRQIDTLLMNHPDYTPAYLTLTDIYYHQGKLSKALENINRAIELSPLDIPPYIDRGIIRYQLNDFQGAMSDYNHVLSKDPNQKTALYNRALLNSFVGLYTKSLEDFDNLLKIDPDNYFAIYNRAMLRVRSGQFQGAIEDLNKVLKRYPDFVVAYVARSTAYKNLGRLREAERDYNKAVERDQAIHKVGYKVKSPANSMKDSRDERDDNIEKYNLLVMSTGNVDAEAQYESGIRGRIQDRKVAVTKRPLIVPSYFIHIDAGSAAVTYLDHQLDFINTKSVMMKPLIMSSSSTALDSVEINRLHEDIKRVSAMMSKPYMSFRRGVDYLLLQDFEQAAIDFDEAIKAHPNLSLAYTFRALAEAKQALVDRNARLEAKEAESKGKKLNLDNDPMHPLQKVNLSLRDPSQLDAKIRQSISDLDKAIHLDDKSILAYYTRGWMLSEVGDFHSAIEDYSKAIHLYPKFADAYYNRGLLKLSMGDIKSGIDDLSRAGELGIYEVYNIIKRLNN